MATSQPFWTNLPRLRRKDEVKFVIASRRDYEWAREMVRTHALTERCPVLFSPAFGRVDPQAMVDWVVADRLGVRFQMQLHKVVWPPDQRGV